jgi:hypothetical protein
MEMCRSSIDMGTRFGYEGRGSRRGERVTDAYTSTSDKGTATGIDQLHESVIMKPVCPSSTLLDSAIAMLEGGECTRPRNFSEDLRYAPLCM